jgi:hypothetical protein
MDWKKVIPIIVIVVIGILSAVFGVDMKAQICGPSPAAVELK